MLPQRFHVTQQHKLGDRHLYGGLSRFITPEVAALFEHCGPTAAESATGQALPRAGSINLASQLRAAWD